MIRNPIRWPNGAKCAACVTFDMDADSLVHIAHPTDGHSRVSAISMLKGGHEIAHHGFLHEHPREVSDEAEAHWLDRGIEVILRATGQRPRGWRAPLYNFSHRSADLLAERGFAYDASLMGDDQPYLLDSAKGRLVELPSHWGLDDWPQYVQSMDLDYMMPIRAPTRNTRWKAMKARTTSTMNALSENSTRYGGATKSA